MRKSVPLHKNIYQSDITLLIDVHFDAKPFTMNKLHRSICVYPAMTLDVSNYI